ncbi:MAG: flavin reductase family protein [Gaiellales bacterium]|nr:MAG: flavin reductase family protein [Gaiellales bacterium]
MKRSLGAQPIAYPSPVFLVGTYDAEGRPNVMTAAWSGLCCSKPPCIAVALRQATYSYGSIVARQAFTVNIPSEDHARQVDHVGLVSGRDQDKFAAAGLTAVASEVVDAPYVEEFPLVLECRLIHTLEIGLHTQFIGEIIDVKAEESVLNEKGKADVEMVRPIIFSPSVRQYHGLGKLLGKAFSMGKPDRG